MASTILSGRGIDHEDLYDVLGQIKTKMTGLCTKLDADGTVTDTDYVATIDTFSFPPGSSGREPSGGINAQGVRHQGIVLDYLKTVRTAYNLLHDKLDADNGTTMGLTMASLIDNATDGLTQAGAYEGALVNWLYTYMTNWNAVLAVLDANGNVADTDYATLWGFNISAYIDSTGLFNRP